MGGMRFRHGETVTRHPWQVGTDDGYGSTPGGFGTDELWDAGKGEGIAYAPAGSTETLADGSTRVTTRATLYDPLARSVGPRDQFTVRGRRYAVDADASGPWIHPMTGWTPGGTIALKAVGGG